MLHAIAWCGCVVWLCLCALCVCVRCVFVCAVYVVLVVDTVFVCIVCAVEGVAMLCVCVRRVFVCVVVLHSRDESVVMLLMLCFVFPPPLICLNFTQYHVQTTGVPPQVEPAPGGRRRGPGPQAGARGPTPQSHTNTHTVLH